MCSGGKGFFVGGANQIKLTLLWLLLRTLRDRQSCSALGTCIASKRLQTINRVASPLVMHLTPLGRPTGYGTLSVAKSLDKPGGSEKQTASTTAPLTPNPTSSSCDIHRLLENYSRQITQTGKPCCRYGNTESFSCQACMVVLMMSNSSRFSSDCCTTSLSKHTCCSCRGTD